MHSQIAQLAEQRTVNPLVVGSSPTLGAMLIKSEEQMIYKEAYHLLGKRIKLIKMLEDPLPIEKNTLGTINYIDDIGTIFVTWDNGRSLGLIPGVDKWTYV